MGGFVFFLVLLALLVIANFAKKSTTDTTRRRVRDQAASAFQRAREQAEAFRGGQRSAAGSGRSAPNIRPAITAEPRQETPQQFWRTLPSPTAPLSSPSGPAAMSEVTDMPDLADLVGPTSDPEAAGDTARTAMGDLRDDPGLRAYLSGLGTLDDLAGGPPTSSVLTDPSVGRYVGSAALDSSLDSTIESSIFGTPDSATVAAVTAGGRPVDLTEDVAAEVVGILDNGHEVAAVRLICDATGCGILDAMRTVEAYR